MSSPHRSLDGPGQPGSPVTGSVELVGGGSSATVEHITLVLVAGDDTEIFRTMVSGPVPLGEDERKAIPFQIALPWEMPITISGAALGLRAEAEIDNATVKGDIGMLSVQPLPVQWRILEAFGTLGWALEDAGIQFTKVPFARPALPVQQVFALRPAPQYASEVGAIELIFNVTSQNVEVLVGSGQQGFPGRYDRYTVAHADADTVDWAPQVDGWVRQALEHRVTAIPLSRDHDDDSGPGIAGTVAGVVGGVAAGYVAGEVLDDLFDDDDDD